MFSDSLNSFWGHNTCNKCRLLASLEARITILELHLLKVDYISLLALTSETYTVDAAALTSETKSVDVVTLANATPPISKPAVTPQPKFQD